MMVNPNSILMIENYADSDIDNTQVIMKGSSYGHTKQAFNRQQASIPQNNFLYTPKGTRPSKGSYVAEHSIINKQSIVIMSATNGFAQ